MPKMQLRLVPALLALATLALLATSRLAAQASTDIVRGTITDSSGAPVVGAQIVVADLGTNVTRTTVTDHNGRFTVIYVDGGGRYRVSARAVGYRPVQTIIARQADEDVLVANLRMGGVAIQLADLNVRTVAPPPAFNTPGEEINNIPNVISSRIPIENRDPTDLVQLSPNTVVTGGSGSTTDSSESQSSFSIAGARTGFNRVTLDGLSLGSALSGGRAGGGAAFSVPPDAIRGTQVVVSTYDVSRGQFAGGQVASQSNRGTNRLLGTVSYRTVPQAFQGGYAGLQGPYSMNEISGGLGGPFKQDKAFFYVSLAGQRRVDFPTALTTLVPSTAGATIGVSPDSVKRFIQIAANPTLYDVAIPGDTGSYSRPGTTLSGLARVDITLGRSTLFFRLHDTWYQLDRTRVGPYDLLQNGGQIGARSAGGFAGLTSQVGAALINEARVEYMYEGRPTLRTVDLPQASVRVASDFPGGSSSIQMLNLGGERSLPTAQSEYRFETTDELSLIWKESHRLKTGVYFNLSSFTQSPSGNRLGTFTFNSLGDFENKAPSAYTRTLNARETTGKSYNVSLYLGDAWRPTDMLQLVYGLRFELDGFMDLPAYNGAVDTAFGVRTDRVRSKGAFSPRFGFTWRLNRPREMSPEELITSFGRAFLPSGRAGAEARRAMDSMLTRLQTDTAMMNRMRLMAQRFTEATQTRILRGGIGYFRGPAPLGLYASTLNNTGLPGSEQILNCLGSSVPTPDFAAYEADPNSIPSSCSGPPTPLPQKLPQVGVFGHSFQAPTTLRATFGVQSPITKWLTGGIDLLGSWGLNLYTAQDVNLDTVPKFTIANEGNRPVYVQPADIIPLTGETPLAASRINPAFGNVLSLESTAKSWNYSVSARLQGRIGKLTLGTNYTLAFNDDQNSFSCCLALQGFAAPTTAGNPNVQPRSISINDRRHTISLIAGLQLPWSFNLATVLVFSSGGAYTPVVSGDINGDGVRNDRAFVFNPATPGLDTALAGAMNQLLATAPHLAKQCLQAQLGQVAGRNSCRSPWMTSLNLSLTGRPPVFNLDRRMELAISVFNLLGGLDRLFNGTDIKGWGANNQIFGIEPLLYVRGFNQATNTYIYQVNQSFARPRWLLFGGANPFQVQLSVRYQLGNIARPGQAPPGPAPAPGRPTTPERRPG